MEQSRIRTRLSGLCRAEDPAGQYPACSDRKLARRMNASVGYFGKMPSLTSPAHAHSAYIGQLCGPTAFMPTTFRLPASVVFLRRVPGTIGLPYVAVQTGNCMSLAKNIPCMTTIVIRCNRGLSVAPVISRPRL